MKKFSLRDLCFAVCIVFAILVFAFNAVFASSAENSSYNVFLPVIFTGKSEPLSLLITEVAYDVGDEPEEEWVEIYNPSDEIIDLSEYKIGDEETQGSAEGMFQFPGGAKIYPGQVIVVANQGTFFLALFGFYPDYEFHDSNPQIPGMVVYDHWGGTNMQLSNSGDEILLLNGKDEIVDSVSWGNSSWAFDPPAKGGGEGCSLERYPVSWDTNSAEDWRDQSLPDPGRVDLTVPQPTPTPTITPLPSPPPPLVINEILADPAGDIAGDANGDGIRDGSDDEFIEILNTADDPIDLSGWTMSDETRVRHVFANGTVVLPGCGIVVFGGGNPSGDFGACIVQIASQGSLGLNNSSDVVILRDVRGRVIDSVTYGSSAGQNQSITRSPDITGAFVQHTLADLSNGALFSPGTQTSGQRFNGCQE